MFRKFILLLILTTTFILSCSTYRVQVGVPATDLSWIRIGQSREEVEDRLGSPLKEGMTVDGFKAVYDYDKGWKPPAERDTDMRPVGLIGGLAADIYTLGGLPINILVKHCQKGMLHVMYDDSYKIFAVKECRQNITHDSCSDDILRHPRRSTLPPKVISNSSGNINCEFKTKLHIESESNQDEMSP